MFDYEVIYLIHFLISGIDEEPRSPAIRLAYLTVLLASVILYAMYCAGLTSFLAVFKLQMPFTNIDELYLNTDYRMVMIDETATLQMLRDGQTEIEKNIYHERLVTVNTVDEGIAMMKEGRRNAFMYDHIIVASKVGHGCEVVKVQTCYYFSPIVFAMQKGLSYRNIINHR